MPHDSTNALIDRIYEAAVVPEQWPTALSGLAEIGRGVGGLLFAVDGSAVRWTSSPSLSERFGNYLSQGWPGRTDRPQRLVTARHAGFLGDLDVYTREEIEREPVYNDFLRPNGLGWAAGTAIPLPTGEMIFVTVERAHENGPVERAAIDRLDTLRAHLARSSMLAARLKLEHARTAAKTLELIGLPALVLAAGGRPLAANKLFEELMPTVACESRTRLVLSDSSADRLFADAMQRLGLDAGAGGVRSIPIAAREARAAMILHLVPVRGAAHDVFSAASAILVVTPVEPRKVPTAEVLQGLFDLTPAEARVARTIAEGKTLDALASAQGLSAETVRSQLKSTLAKTGLHRQAELAALLAGLRL